MPSIALCAAKSGERIDEIIAAVPLQNGSQVDGGLRK